MRWAGYFSSEAPELASAHNAGGCGCVGCGEQGSGTTSISMDWSYRSTGKGCGCEGVGDTKRGSEESSAGVLCGEPLDDDSKQSESSILVVPPPSVSAAALVAMMMKADKSDTSFDASRGAFWQRGPVSVLAGEEQHRDDLGYSQTCPRQETVCPQADPAAFTSNWETSFRSIDRDPADVANRGVISSYYQTGGADIWHRIPNANRVRPQAMSDWLADIHPQAPFCPPLITDAGGVVTALALRPHGLESCSRVRVITGWVKAPDDAGLVEAHGGAIDYLYRSTIADRPVVHGPVRAMSDGVVVWKGYNPSAGNVLVIEYDNGGEPFRSAFHHLVDGRDHDVFLAGVATYAWCLQRAAGPPDDDPCAPPSDINENGAAYTNYVKAIRDAFRLGSGLDPLERWGTNATVTRVNVGDTVRMGQVVGYVGDTGFNSSGVHLHASLARRVTSSEWLFFDPYGLYGGAECYRGLYPSGEDPAQLQQPSIFCPVMPAFAGCSRDVLALGLETYDRVGWSPRSVCRYATGSRWAGSFESDPQRSRQVRLGASLAELAEVAAQNKWVPLSLLPDDYPGAPSFSAVLVRSRPGSTFQVSVPAWQANELRADPQVVIQDACIYRGRAGGEQLALTTHTAGLDIPPTRLEWDLDVRSLREVIRSARRDDWSPVKIQPYLSDQGLRYLLLLRRSQGVQRRYFLYQSESIYANAAIALLEENFRPISVAAIQYAAQPVIAVVYEETD